jgi:transcriptional regulator with XRE-family HTH domain
MPETTRGAVTAGAALTRRMEELGLSQQELAQLAKVSTSTIRKLQRGTQPTYQRAKLAALSRALQWPADALARLLDGADPVGIQAVDAHAVPAALSGKIARLSERDRRLVELIVDNMLGER